MIQQQISDATRRVIQIEERINAKATRIRTLLDSIEAATGISWQGAYPNGKERKAIKKALSEKLKELDDHLEVLAKELSERADAANKKLSTLSDEVSAWMG